jgi:ribosomal protein S18 acetylase RimI-like enzyme
MEIKQILDSNIESVEPLALEAKSEGFNFVQRTIDEWRGSSNKFSKKGEIMYGIFVSDLCVGIGGLNIDPYLHDPNIGRIRHLYISRKHRREGLASLLLNKLIKSAVCNFESLRLSTNNPIASSFYESRGFKSSKGLKVTHILKDLNYF